MPPWPSALMPPPNLLKFARNLQPFYLELIARSRRARFDCRWPYRPDRTREREDEKLAFQSNSAGHDRAAGAERRGVGGRKRQFRLLERDAPGRLRLFRSHSCFSNRTKRCRGP